MVSVRAVGRAMQVALGVAEVLSKIVTHRLLEPAIKLDEPDDWFTEKGIRPRIVGEFEDSALLKAFGQAGAGLFPVPSIVEAEVCRQYHARPIGVVDGVVERFYAISVERRVTHPAVAAICTAARTKLFE